MRSRVRALLSGVLLAGLATAAPAHAVVGGKDAAPGAYPAVAFVDIAGLGACTGTLIASDVVLTAGHCGSLTGTVIATPIGVPPGMIGVTLGAQTPHGAGERVVVKAVQIPPSYLNTQGSDVSLLRLTKAAATTPVHVAGRGEQGLWAPGVSGTIVGYGATKEGGSEAAQLQEASVPVIDDATCGTDYPGAFDPATQLCAGFPQGGVDTCQGDSGGPLFGHRPDGSLVVVGATSTGEGCARAGKPGIYARVAASRLREWIRSVAADAVDPDVTAPAA
ncbi:MAG: serine protease, partial [Solirubrobacterales bacterium]|nr:serine protease [Solirubrobacterales bacterium]